MDPDALLEEIRALIHEASSFEEYDAPELLAELRDKTQALDEWLCRGGFLPRKWGTRNG